MSRGQTIQWPNALHPPPDNLALDAQYQHLLTPRPQAEIKKPNSDSSSDVRNGTMRVNSTQSSNTTNNISPSDRINGSLASGQSNSNSSSLKQTIGPGNISLSNLPPPAPVDVPLDLGLLGANSTWQAVGATNSLSFGSKNSSVKDVNQLEQTAIDNGMLSMSGAGFQVGKIAATAFGAVAGITLLVCIIIAITRSCLST
ncbi:uncharacterized protein MELLADRAFT_111437 [Melampsora larici-populina 98AG31]|uniref:Uncharacterized protein n=1 Tax=Melampsora larici-populina (strain 98AG31 / pathotype 3-4-7) TaxID=747676 RepID=F4S371_MELLP|nr:uncharacterized protein MELLADRAFT_111437 [Melampsora larici-populina 98AG31]EGG00959.1 hypothetical protein MELLADRAFT_111437 [Melampsora larici-populina 98AG31]